MAHGQKHKGFEEEHEWRFLCMWNEGVDSETAVRHRASARGLIPYVCIPLPTEASGLLSLERIFVGPCVDDQVRQGAESLLRRHGYDWRRIVTPSGIPYRAGR